MSTSLVAACLLAAAACARPPARFSAERARAHVRMLADSIGSRPVGSEANRRAREYIVAQLLASGFAVRVQAADAQRRGTTAHVNNIIATRPGRRGEAIALVTHYDSVPDGPGAADDGLGVAVCLEAGRVLAQRKAPNYATALIFTDGEEVGLMGAIALTRDPIMGWIRAVMNFEAIGSGGPDVLFETAPGSGIVVGAWARAAFRPAGASYMADVYRHLPNSTDFTVFSRSRVPGINFAAVGDGFTYHTDRDTFARLDPGLLERAGETAVRTVEALDASDELSDRHGGVVTYFDVVRRWAVMYGTRTGWILFAASLLSAVFGWVTVLSVAREAAGWGRMILTVVWTLVGITVVAGAMVGAVWLLRATRETYQPWYSHPDRLLAYLVFVGILAGWAVVRVGRFLPPGIRGSSHSAVAWSIILPFWAALAVAAQTAAPSAAYLAVIPLLAAGLTLTVSPLRRAAGVRVASALVLAVAGALWAGSVRAAFHFAVTTFARLPIVTPIYVYPALLLLFGLFLVPPSLPLVAGWQPFLARRQARRSRTAVVASPGLLLLALVVFAAAWCWFAPAYTEDRPMHAGIIYVNDLKTGRARWQVGSNEPAAHVGVKAPLAGSWQSGFPPPGLGRALRPPAALFPFYGVASDREAPPVTLAGALKHEGDAAFVEMSAVPLQPGLTVTFRLPEGVVPEETNLAGAQPEGSPFIATYVALPPGGITLRARVGSSDARRLESGELEATAEVLANANGLPGATWPALPGWLPREHIAWHARSYYVIAVPLTMATRKQRGSGNR